SAAGEPARRLPPRSRPERPAAPAGDRPGDVGRGRHPPAHLRTLLKQAERELRGLDHRRGELIAALSTAGSDHERLGAIGRELAEVESTLADVEHRWLELSEQADD
ncbi:MAG: ABC transporter C-terminal domain-containing protein, partial [Acidimicrobiales bacterium]